MSDYNIKYPIAYHKKTGKLINAEDAINGKDCGCICLDCGINLIAKNQGKFNRPHFSHPKNPNCNGSYESYIHSLAKEVFKNLKDIELPPIKLFNIIDSQNDVFLKKIEKILNSSDLPYNLDKINKEIEIQKELHLKIKKYSIEEIFKSSLGKIKVDIVIYVDEKKLFVEPFLTSKIDSLKESKIQDLDVSTISINLQNFRTGINQITIEGFTSSIRSSFHKEWFYISAEKKKKIEKEFLKKLEEKLKISLINTEINKIRRDLYE